MQTTERIAGRSPGPPLRLADNNAVDPGRLPLLEQLFNAHHDKVFRAAYRVTGNASDAEDVVQTVFLRLIRNQQQFQDIEEAGNYLYRAGVNAALDVVRARRTSSLDEHDPPEPGWKPDRAHHSPELR